MNNIHHKMWDEFRYPFPNFDGAAVEVWEWISTFIPGFKGFYSRKYNQLHTSGICGLLRLTSIYITYFVRIKPLVYTMIFQWYVTRLPRVIFNQSQMTRFYMSEISLKYFERNLRARSHTVLRILDYLSVLVSKLTHLPLVPHICVNESD